MCPSADISALSIEHIREVKPVLYANLQVADLDEPLGFGARFSNHRAVWRFPRACRLVWERSQLLTITCSNPR
jgi:hypothetical protein